ncbi:hypothetical protein OsI_15474 [Oryza sativa Indica Group]|uniref:Uncharacterized protein n=2 Tax=Oryza sativa TaxID=4530 RepID=B9FEL9_ORYSJ|nr:hypothetical protein OsI_15474 [Oryza sativa Indica Group]EEE60802.1 hypothetical protein OsJ_14398 [Oryza sativa Japonica Group]
MEAGEDHLHSAEKLQRQEGAVATDARWGGDLEAARTHFRCGGCRGIPAAPLAVENGGGGQDPPGTTLGFLGRRMRRTMATA